MKNTNNLNKLLLSFTILVLISSCGDYKKTGPKSFSISYNTNGADLNLSDLPIDSKSYFAKHVAIVKSPHTLGKTGKIFNYWSTKPDKSGVIYRPGDGLNVEKDTVLFAIWGNPQIKKYTISYDANTGVGPAPIDENEYITGDEVLLKNSNSLTKEGYYFIAWTLTPNDNNTSNHHHSNTTIEIDKDIKLYAYWVEKEQETFSITYNGNGYDSGTVPLDSDHYKAGEIGTARSPDNLSKSGYTFEKWSYIDDNNQEQYIHAGDPLVVNKNITLKAFWTQKTTYSILYEGNGADFDSSTVIDSNHYESGEKAIVQAHYNLKKNGFIFDYWSLNRDGSVGHYNAGDELTITENKTLYAIWRDTIKISFDGNGSTAGSRPDTFYIAKNQTFFMNSPKNMTKTNSIFSSWNTKEDRTGVTILTEEASFFTEDITLYAQWTSLIKPYYRPTAGSGSGYGLDGNGTLSYSENHEMILSGYTDTMNGSNAKTKGDTFNGTYTLIPGLFGVVDFPSSFNPRFKEKTYSDYPITQLPEKDYQYGVWYKKTTSGRFCIISMTESSDGPDNWDISESDKDPVTFIGQGRSYLNNRTFTQGWDLVTSELFVESIKITE